jgi:hypothetical protein
VAPKELLEGLGIDQKWGIFLDMTLNGAKNFGGNVFGFLPVLLIPFLKY